MKHLEHLKHRGDSRLSRSDRRMPNERQDQERSQDQTRERERAVAYEKGQESRDLPHDRSAVQLDSEQQQSRKRHRDSVHAKQGGRRQPDARLRQWNSSQEDHRRDGLKWRAHAINEAGEAGRGQPHARHGDQHQGPADRNRYSRGGAHLARW